MFQVEIGPLKDSSGWFAVVSYTYKSELVAYQPAKVHQRRVESADMLLLMDRVTKLAVFHSAAET